MFEDTTYELKRPVPFLPITFDSQILCRKLPQFRGAHSYNVRLNPDLTGHKKINLPQLGIEPELLFAQAGKCTPHNSIPASFSVYKCLQIYLRFVFYSAVVAGLGNIISQILAPDQTTAGKINWRSVFAYTTFGY